MTRRTAVAGRILAVSALAAVGLPSPAQDLRDVAATPNQFRTADALERFYADATDCDCDLARSVRYLRLAPPDEARDGLDALGGQELAGLFDPRRSLSTAFHQRLTWQLRPAGPEPPRQVIDYVDAPVGGAGPTAIACDTTCGRRTYLADPRPATWVQGFGAGLDGGDGADDYDAGMGGLLFGGHLPVGDDAAFGLAANYGHVDAEATRTDLDVDTWRFLGYGRYAGETFYALGGAGYGFDDYATSRRIAFGPFDRVAAGDTTGNEAFGFAEAGLTLPVSATLALQPFVGLSASRLTRDGFTERNAGDLPLVVSGADTSSFATSLGGRAVAQRHLAPDLLLRPELRLAWWHDYLAEADSTTVAFVRDTSVPFTVDGVAPDADAALLGAGATLVAWGQCSLGAQYDAALASGASLHAFAVTALCTW